MQQTVDANDHGAFATRPSQYLLATWRDILGRVWTNMGTHNVSLMAAGVAFYAFLSFVPLLAALVMSYGLIADPASIAGHMKTIIGVVPKDAAKLIYDQLLHLTTAAATQKGIGLAIALAVSIYGATRASGALMTAMNVIYEEEDRRGFIRGTIVSGVLIVGAVIIGIIGVLAASMLGYAQKLLGDIGPAGALVVKLVTWLGAAFFCALTIAAMYRFAPDRKDARWRWLSLGSILATILWLAATMLFGVYAAKFGNYDATYGSLGAVVVLLLWLYISAYVVLLGALLNAEAERQTARDSTTGHERPMGHRGAVLADTSVANDKAGPAHQI
jgi:membrane protein